MIEKLRAKNPLIHHITNYVTANFCANVCLSIGASPLMADEEDEMSEIAAISNAFVINIGTINYRSLDSAIEAVEHYSKANKPIILDPVGVGASRFRTAALNELLRAGKITTIKANAGEIASILGVQAHTKGVDSHQKISEEFFSKARDFAAENEIVLAISGEKDYIINQDEILCIENGQALCKAITGAGCVLASVVAAFHTISEPFNAAKEAFLYFNIASELASLKASSPASFQVALIDELYNLSEADIAKHSKFKKL